MPNRKAHCAHVLAARYSELLARAEERPVKNSGSSRGMAFLEPTEFFQVGQEDPALRLYLRYDLFRVLDEFSNRDPKKELAALLVGQMHEIDEGIFLVVEDAIEVAVGDEQGPQSEGSSKGGGEGRAAGAGRFGPRTWQHARRVAQAKYQDRSIVGWFHTHHGKGLDPTVEEKEVHARYFPEPWQTLYVIDPVVKDRNFFRPLEGRLGALKGYRIFGKESAQEVAIEKERAVRSPSTVKSEDQLRERYLERSLEKIQRMLRRPALRPIDVLLVLLLVGNLALTWLRPLPMAKVDTSAMVEGQKKLSEQVKTANLRLEKLEQHLAAMRVIDEQLAIAPTASPTPRQAPESASEPSPSSPSPAPAVAVSVSPSSSASPSTTASKAPEPGSDNIKSYLVTKGDTLSIIAERFYGSSGSHTIKGLAHFNHIKGMEIFPGDTLKIPAKDKLH